MSNTLRAAALNVACRWISNVALHDVVADLDLQMAIEMNALVDALQHQPPTTPGDQS